MPDMALSSPFRVCAAATEGAPGQQAAPWHHRENKAFVMIWHRPLCYEF